MEIVGGRASAEMLTRYRLSPASRRSVGTWRVARRLVGRIWGRASGPGTLPVSRPPHPLNPSRNPDPWDVLPLSECSPFSLSSSTLSLCLSPVFFSSLSVFLSSLRLSLYLSLFLCVALSLSGFCCIRWWYCGQSGTQGPGGCHNCSFALIYNICYFTSLLHRLAASVTTK